MKLLLQVLFFLFLSTSVFAQVPILTATNTNPQVGDTYFNHYVYVPGTFVPGPTGANVIWDHTTIPSDTNVSGTSVFYAANSLPNFTSFPTANIGYLRFGTFEFYYIANSDSQSLVKGDVHGENLTENPKRILTFPFTFNDSFSDDFSGTSPFGGNDSVRYGTTQVEADAYGTLLLPYGSIQGVLRVKSEASFVDSSDAGVFYRFTETDYRWYKPGIHFPILAYKKIESNVLPTFIIHYIMDQSTALSIDPLAEDLAFSFYPNPAVDKIHISYHLKGPAATVISLTDIMGRELITQSAQSMPGYAQKVLDVSHLKTGTYILSLSTGNKRITRKVIIQ